MMARKGTDSPFWAAPPDGKPLAMRDDVDERMIAKKGTATLVKHDWQWRNLADAADLPAAVHLVNGLLINGNITLWYAPVKTGKSRLLMGLLAAMSPGGPQFCGMDLATTPTLLFTEEPPTAIGERVRDFGIPREANHRYNNAAALPMRPEVFADEVLTTYQNNNGEFGLIAVDTLGAFVNCGDWNDYAATGAAMSPPSATGPVSPQRRHPATTPPK